MTAKKKMFWVVNFTVLALFSFYTVSGFLGFGTAQAYAATLKKDDFHSRSKNFVVVDKDKEHDKDGDKHKHKGGDKEPDGSLDADQEICTLTPTQAAELNAFFHVKIFDIKIDGENTVQVAAVHGKHLTKSQLLDFLKASDQSLDCHVVGIHHIFFLPVIPQLS